MGVSHLLPLFVYDHRWPVASRTKQVSSLGGGGVHTWLPIRHPGFQGLLTGLAHGVGMDLWVGGCHGLGRTRQACAFLLAGFLVGITELHESPRIMVSPLPQLGLSSFVPFW